eukprot:4220783-Amphidinium_carterae.1
MSLRRAPLAWYASGGAKHTLVGCSVCKTMFAAPPKHLEKVMRPYQVEGQSMKQEGIVCVCDTVCACVCVCARACMRVRACVRTCVRAFPSAGSKACVAH